MKANYWVFAVGRDCDGYNNGRVYPFLVEANAIDFANVCNEGSDGILYYVTSDLEAMQEYCIDYGHDWTNYLEANTQYEQDIENTHQ